LTKEKLPKTSKSKGPAQKGKKGGTSGEGAERVVGWIEAHKIKSRPKTWRGWLEGGAQGNSFIGIQVAQRSSEKKPSLHTATPGRWCAVSERGSKKMVLFLNGKRGAKQGGERKETRAGGRTNGCKKRTRKQDQEGYTIN